MPYISTSYFTLTLTWIVFLHSILRSLDIQYSLPSCVQLIDDAPLSRMSWIYRADEMVSYTYMSIKAVSLPLHMDYSIGHFFTKVFLSWSLGLKLQKDFNIETPNLCLSNHQPSTPFPSSITENAIDKDSISTKFSIFCRWAWIGASSLQPEGRKLLDSEAWGNNLLF